RIFLKGGSLALVSLGFAPEFFTRAVQASRARRKVLVTVFQRGAVDGLNMIVPFGEAAYYQSRPSIAIARPGTSDGALDLNGFLGLNARAAGNERRPIGPDRLFRSAPEDGPAQAAVGQPLACDRARLRLARHHAI